MALRYSASGFSKSSLISKYVKCLFTKMINDTYNQQEWRKTLRKCPVKQKDLEEMGVWHHKEEQLKQLYLYDQRGDCILIQGAGILYQGKIYLVLGVGAINVLESFSQFNETQGVVGTGNALFLSKKCQQVYSALNKEETLRRYEIDKTGREFKYGLGGGISKLITINRVFMDEQEFLDAKQKKLEKIVFDLGNTFFTEPIPFSGRKKSRLRDKFVDTARTVHCVHHPTLMEKELFFDSAEQIRSVISQYPGFFMLGYTYFSRIFADSIGLVANFGLDLKYNPSGITSFTILKLIEQFCKKYPELQD